MAQHSDPVIEYVPDAPASHHTRERNSLVFTSADQLRPEHQDHPARYRFCLPYLSASDIVLDCACGCGYGTALLAERAGSVVGIDLYKDLIDFANTYWSRPHVQYLAHDVCADLLPFPDNSFSAVVSMETIEHLPDPERVLIEFRRVLKNGGILLLSTPQAPMGNPNHIHEFTLGELCQVIAKTGFPVMETFVQTNATEITSGTAPVIGRPNLLVAGRDPQQNPLAVVVDEQYALQRGLRKEIIDIHTQLQSLNKAIRVVQEDKERACADALAEIRRLQTEVQDLSNLRVMRLYRRLTSSLPYRILRRMMRGH